STHRSRVVDPDGPTTFLDHREALPGIPQTISFTKRPGHRAPSPVEYSPPPISENSHWGEAQCSLAPCRLGSNVRSPSVSGWSGFAPAKYQDISFGLKSSLILIGSLHYFEYCLLRYPNELWSN